MALPTLPGLMNLLLDAVCVVNEQGVFLSVGGACEHIFGYRPEEMIGRQMLELIHPDDRERTMKAVGRLMNGHLQYDFENRYIRKDGSIVYIMWSARWYKDQKIRVAVARDVSERRARESEAPGIPSVRRWRLLSAPPSLVPPGAAPIPLSGQDFRVLTALAASRDAVSRRDIVKALGQDYIDYDRRRLDSQMRRLRRKVEHACGLKLPVATLRGVGYRFYDQIEVG